MVLLQPEHMKENVTSFNHTFIFNPHISLINSPTPSNTSKTHSPQKVTFSLRNLRSHVHQFHPEMFAANHQSSNEYQKHFSTDSGEGLKSMMDFKGARKEILSPKSVSF
ncbi:hypothetical protein JTE90_021064 [Oedothorax gibbosus]|uniref:Uncharacterized protein n=1 Tax=Oedothorax gibbosus TaxID=931172 RepID=A0AAV6VTA6_9ARAC|nr:hypothetical protein JTE90_021064 [Oedothorax gibbosus]